MQHRRVLNPRLFGSVLHMATKRWRCHIGNAGFDFGDALPRLLDLRFAGDTLLLARTRSEAAILIDNVVSFLGDAGLKLNVGKTGVPTSESQPPPTLDTPSKLIVFLNILGQHVGHKWLGCMLTTASSPNHTFIFDIICGSQCGFSMLTKKTKPKPFN